MSALITETEKPSRSTAPVGTSTDCTSKCHRASCLSTCTVSSTPPPKKGGLAAPGRKPDSATAVTISDLRRCQGKLCQVRAAACQGFFNSRRLLLPSEKLCGRCTQLQRQAKHCVTAVEAISANLDGRNQCWRALRHALDGELLSIKRWCGFVRNATPAAYDLLPKIAGTTAAGAAHEAGARALLQAVGIDCEASSTDRARAQREEVQSILLSAKTCVHDTKCWLNTKKNGAPFCHGCKGWVLPIRTGDLAPECEAGCDINDNVCDACNCAVCEVHGFVEDDKRWCSACACALMMCSVDLVAARCSMEALRGTATIGVSREMDLQEMALGDAGRQQRDAFNKVTGCVGGTCYPVSENHHDLSRLPYPPQPRAPHSHWQQR